LVFGLASLVLAALYLLSQRDLKRLLAYSSVEHMGILAIGMSFSAPLAIVGVLLHVIAHGAAKGTAFFGAGSVVRKFKTKDLLRIRGGAALMPWSGTMLVLAVLALSAMPPFGIFRSEFMIVAGGLSDPQDAIAATLVVLVTLAFFGLSWFTTETMVTPARAIDVARLGRREPSRYIVVAMICGLTGLVILGIHVPGQLSDLLHNAAGQLEAAP
jgi:hydrogenase-4 component F